MRSWREIKILLKRRFSILSDLDFAGEEKNRENMLDHVALKINKTRTELDLLFTELKKY